ncbi:CBS domain-containing protein [Clostridium collagenovorans DSM 3089]|uniref:CBS domain-containing protein n=1 Tax=Clostridium collagenovorans DSM 3089 TaxID=1121306 RepID=A0A1M5XYG3_9CLOT|nr:CBS domain-containing protein [Clostridium collagenovorans]SHI04772.1 CBS domain-containing protein [Clostridium collagenovorans DSM 3089]
MYVKDIMTINVVSANPESTVESVADLMKNHHIGMVPICDDNNKVIGVITDRDIVLRSVSQGEECKNQRVREIMTSNPTLISREIDINEAADIMGRKQIRRLPVIDDSGLIGIISLGDVSQELEHKDTAGEALSNISSYSSSEN